MGMQASVAITEEPDAFPVREYIGSMALELAQMARSEGDEVLGRLLDCAAALAGDPAVRRPLVTMAARAGRPA